MKLYPYLLVMALVTYLIRILPLAHPRQIGALGAHSEKWCNLHREWEKSRQCDTPI